jgi:hypothetical protein
MYKKWFVYIFNCILCYFVNCVVTKALYACLYLNNYDLFHICKRLNGNRTWMNEWKFWEYQNSEALGAWTVCWCISIQKIDKSYRIQGLRATLFACLPVTLSVWEIIAEKFCHTGKNWDTVLFCLKKKVILSSFPKYDIIHTSITSWCECLQLPILW